MWKIIIVVVLLIILVCLLAGRDEDLAELLGDILEALADVIGDSLHH